MTSSGFDVSVEVLEVSISSLTELCRLTFDRTGRARQLFSCFNFFSCRLEIGGVIFISPPELTIGFLAGSGVLTSFDGEGIILSECEPGLVWLGV